MLNYLKHNFKKLVFKFIKPPYYSNTYSQAGEDVVIDFLLKGIGLNRPSYLELGVYIPDYANNTFLFYRRGSKGVLVEADETLIHRIREVRPKDTILNIGVGITNQKEADFYIFEDRGLNTFSKEEAEYRQNNGSYKIQKVVKVSLVSINQIISENFDKYPDFLSIDIEGFDLPVLKELNFNKYPIPIICAETCTYSENHIKAKDKNIEEFMLTKGYFVYADTYINTIFVNEQWFNTIGIK